MHLARLMGEEKAQMLGKEGWKPTANEAHEAGLVQWLVSEENLQDEAQNREELVTITSLANSWEAVKDELIEAQTRVSGTGQRFLAAKFLHGQAKFLWKKGKYVPAMLFYTLLALRPIWGLTLK